MTLKHRLFFIILELEKILSISEKLEKYSQTINNECRVEQLQHRNYSI